MADRYQDREGRSDGPDRNGDENRAARLRIAIENPRHQKGSAQARQREDGRLGERHESGAGDPGEDASGRRGVRVPKPESHEGEREDRRDVDPVLLDLGAVTNEGHADRERRDGERHRVPREQALRQPQEEHQRREAGDQREEPERQVARAEDPADALLGQEESDRRHLVVAERLEEQLLRGSVHQVSHERQLVEPE